MANTPLIKKGKCINPECKHFAEKTVFEIGVGEEFVCPECGGMLVEERKTGGGSGVIWGVVAAVVIAGGGAGGYFALRDTNVYVTGIQPGEKVYTLVEGQETTITATVQPDDATDKTLVWSSSDAEVATVSNGTVKAAKAGKAVITIKSNDGKAVTEVEVTVEEPVVEETEEVDTTVYVSAIKAEKENCTVTVGKEETIVVTVEPEDAADKTLAWSSSDESVLTVADGTVKGVKAGKAVVTVKSNDGKAETTVEVEVKPVPAPAWKGITFTGKSKNGYPHGTGTMTFKSARRIDTHDQKNRTAQAGDYLIGEWDQGHLVQARWYDSANNLKETIVLGKAMNPEQDRSLYK